MNEPAPKHKKTQTIPEKSKQFNVATKRSQSNNARAPKMCSRRKQNEETLIYDSLLKQTHNAPRLNDFRAAESDCGASDKTWRDRAIKACQYHLFR
jgi:hypothetical protein